MNKCTFRLTSLDEVETYELEWSSVNARNTEIVECRWWSKYRNCVDLVQVSQTTPGWANKWQGRARESNPETSPTFDVKAVHWPIGLVCVDDCTVHEVACTGRIPCINWIYIQLNHTGPRINEKNHVENGTHTHWAWEADCLPIGLVCIYECIVHEVGCTDRYAPRSIDFTRK